MDLNEMRRRFKEQRAQSKDNGQLADNSDETIISSSCSNKKGNAERAYSPNNSQQTLHFEDGAMYVGSIDESGKFVGHGVYTFPDGTIYDGLWLNGLRNGAGTQTWTDGTKYVGNWKNGLRQGTGTITWSNGDKYVGSWKDDNISNGHYYYVDGAHYDGEFNSEWDRDGYGTQTWPNGYKYVGSWKDDNISNGHYYYVNGDHYDGEFNSEWKREGYGTYYWADGRRHCGTWKQDMKHGKGQYIDNNGVLICEGEWLNDEYVEDSYTQSESTPYYEDSSIFSRVEMIILEQLDVDPSSVVESASFVNDLGADSLDIVELIMALEQEFNISIPDEQADRISTVGDAVRYIEANI